MPLRFCEYTSCSQAAERTSGSCMICSQHHCVKHSNSPYHDCPTEAGDEDAYYEASAKARKEQALAKLRKIDVAALKQIARALRGLPCRIRVLEGVNPNFELALTQMGGMNCNIDIDFEDGVTWLARVRLTYPNLPPDSVQDCIFLSEVATLKFLESTEVPSPQVYYHAISGPSNPVGVSFLLMEKLQGSPFQWQKATAKQRTKVMQQLARFYLEMEKHPFQSSGSLQLAENGSIEVGPVAQALYFQTPEKSLGPFDDFESSLRATVQAQIELICNGELAPFAADNYLTQCWRLSKIADVAALDSSSAFYLKHAEDKGDHILIDEDYNVTGIIDWEFATTEPAAVAFSSPCMMWPVGDFYDGRNNLSVEEEEFAAILEKRGRPDMSDMVRRGRKIQRFIFVNGGSVAADRADFEALFQGLRAAMADTEGDINTFADWKEKALGANQHDEKLQTLLQAEDAKLS